MVVGDFTTRVETVIIGAGPGGYVAAIRAAQLGQDIALIERDRLGGMCLNWGCIPSKALIEISGLKYTIENASEMGIVASDVHVDVSKLQSWKEGIVDKLRKGVDSLLQKNGVDVIEGTASFSEPGLLFVDARDRLLRIEYENVIIATGSRPKELSKFPVDGETIINIESALSLQEIPEKFIIIGAGSVGVEIGTVYAKLGSHVTIVEAQDQLFPDFEPEIGRILKKSIQSNSIDLRLGAAADLKSLTNGRATISITQGKQTEEIDADKVLVAIGHQPTTSELGLENIGLAIDDRGFINVNERLQTKIENIYAIGDIVEGSMLAHRASYMGKVAAEVIAGESAAFDNIAIPGVVFSDPEIATVGLTESQAEKMGYKTKSGIFPFKALGRALTLGESAGMTKIVSDAQAGTVLGVHIIGAHASDLIAEGALAVETAAHIEDLVLTIRAHPTLPEGMGEAAEVIENKAIHIFQPS
jgi:dihydrolipoamide dehydrogenase